MNAQELVDTARALVAGDKGLLAMDESNPTCNKRFAKLGIPQTVEARRAYRELIVIQQPALEIWQGEDAHVPAAQRALYHRARCNQAARRGEYNAAMERE
jgi:fructose-bisphosphate aldolase class 1